MIRLCHNDESTIYDDEKGNWFWEGDHNQTIPKNEQPLFPLAAIIKYGMIEDNKDEIDKLRQFK
jgi:hypothetical protein